MIHVLWSVWPFLATTAAIAVWARWRPPARRRSDGTRWRRVGVGATEGALAVSAALLFGALAGFYLPRHFIVGGDYGEVDFAGYCRSLAAVRDGVPSEWRVKHSAVVGALLAFPTRAVGILGALTGGALVSAFLYGLGVYLWARAAGGRVAGLAAVLFAAANQSISWIARSPSFYPEVVACCVLGTAGVAVALRWRTRPALWVGGAGAGLILAMDVRCFTIGAWSVLLLAGVALRAPWRAIPGRALALVLPIAASWWAAHAAHVAIAGDVSVPGVVQQGLGYFLDVPGYRADVVPFPVVVREDMVWGVDAPWRAFGALRTLAALARGLPADAGGATEQLARDAYLWPWVPLLVCAALAGLGGLRARPAGWWSMALLGVPFAMNVALVFHTLARSTYYALGMSIVPVVLGVGLAALGGKRWSSRPAVVLLAWMLASVTGLIPSFLSPMARWRVPDMAHNRVYDARARATGGVPAPGLASEWPDGEDARPCVEALHADVLAGKVSIPFSDAPRPVPRDRPPLGILPTGR